MIVEILLKRVVILLDQPQVLGTSHGQAERLCRSGITEAVFFKNRLYLEQVYGREDLCDGNCVMHDDWQLSMLR